MMWPFINSTSLAKHVYKIPGVLPLASSSAVAFSVMDNSLHVIQSTVPASQPSMIASDSGHML